MKYLFTLCFFLVSSLVIATDECTPNPLDLKTFANQDECIHCDLQCADLRGGHYRNKNLFYTDLYGAQLQNTFFSGNTSFIEANLNTANLSYGNFRAANFGGAQLLSANLQFADFTAALLWGGNFIDADFTGAVLQDSNLDYAIFRDSNLTDEQICQAKSYQCIMHPSGKMLVPCGDYVLTC